MPRTSTRQKLDARLFQAVHGRNLIYNTCWEDPALDRAALQLGPADRVLVITSAGCNSLDYLLAGPAEVHAVDVNPIQNALLELKRAAILGLDYESFFELFGRGRSPRARQMYGDVLRRQLSPAARAYWDRHLVFFLGRGWRQSFYYRGTAGFLAKLVLTNAHVLQRLREPIEEMLAARSVEQQRAIYHERIEPRFWTPWLKWFLSRSFTLTLMGVPWPQRDQIVTQYPGGVARFVRDAVETVLCELPFADNYFWRVYIQGHYTPGCCPEYLKRDNFDRLRALLPRLRIHTTTVTAYLRREGPALTRFVLLDHMDWMSCGDPRDLAEEWTALLARAAPSARAIFRSAGLHVEYLDRLQVQHRGRQRPLGELLHYHRDLADRLHARDRVHTYGSFHIADLP